MAADLVALSLLAIICVVNGYVVGIDVGTTYSRIGVMRRGMFELILNDYGNRMTPSVISFTDTSILVGDEVQNQRITNPQNTVYEFKRLMGQRYTTQIHDYFNTLPFQVINASNGEPLVNVYYKGSPSNYTPIQLSSMLFAQLKESSETYLGEPVSDAIVTVPSHFDDTQQQATKDAAVSAGFNVIQMIPAPVAALTAYESRRQTRQQRKELIIVYHLGGNSLEVSLLELDGSVITVIATAHDDQLGGTYFDQNVANYFIDVFKRKSGIDISNNERAKAILTREIEKAKRSLSSQIQRKIDIVGLVDGIDFRETLTRARFESLNHELFKKTLQFVAKVLKDGNVEKDAIDDLILIGGSTNIPKIRLMVNKFFDGKEIKANVYYRCIYYPCAINPDEAVTYGAVQAIAAHDIAVSHSFVEWPGVVLNAQSINIDINNHYASITYSFEFENINQFATELRYELSIDSGAYISHFVGEIDDEIYKGITKEKDKACKEYKKAQRDNKNAILLSQNHEANTFKIQTNLQPQSKAVLNVSVEQLMVRVFGVHELSLELTDIDNHLQSNLNVIPISITLTNNDDVQSIEIPFGTYDVTQSTSNTQTIEAQITKQSGKSGNALSYFIFRYQSAQTEYNEMVIDTKSNTFLHRLGFDKEQQKILPRRVVFVLDKSGSMWPIWKEAQSAISGAINKLSHELDRFGVVLFDSDVERWDIRRADARTIRKAVRYIADTQPATATNLFGGIERALKMIAMDMDQKGNHNSDGAPFVNQIVFVTDGMANVGVTAADDILQGIYDINSQLSAPVSIFGIGIGDDQGTQWVEYLNYPLIRQISIQNGGFDQRVKRSETRQHLSRFYKILQSPQLSNIDVRYASDEYHISKTTQTKFNTLYADTDIVICGKLERKDTAENIANINSVIQSNGNNKIEKAFEVSAYDLDSVDIDRIWAYLSLQNYERLLLQHGYNVDGAMRRLINENALNVALTYKLVTQWTSMIVVADKEEGTIDVTDMEDRNADWDDAQPMRTMSGDQDYGETAGILLLDVTPLSLGIETYGGIMHTIIVKHSVIPVKKSIHVKGKQLPRISDGVVIRVVQGERVNASDNILLGEYNWTYDESTGVEVTFTLDVNGELTITTNDEIHVNAWHISAHDSRPSQDEIDQMLSDADKYKHEDERYAKQAIMESVSAVKAILSDDGLRSKMSDKDVQTLLLEIERVNDWVGGHYDAAPDQVLERKREFEDNIENIISAFF
eukprot:1167688_1